MMNLIIHRGTHEIGGSCVEIRSSKNKIVVDIGMPLVDRSGEPFDFKKHEELTGPELVEKRILPNIQGFYEWDQDNPPIDGMLISHPHMDHYGFFRYLRKDIQFYIGRAAKKIIDLTVTFTSMEGQVQNHHPMNSGDPFSCGNFKITPYLMDHSAFDAYAFVIEADGKKIIYSGDFREHGRKQKAFRWFLNHASKYVDAMLLEGTMFGRGTQEFKSEKDIEEKTVELTGKTDQIVFLCFSAQNIVRLVSFYRASLRTKRLFVIDVYTANVLDALKGTAKLPYPSGNYSNIRVFFPYWLCRRMTREGKEKLLYKFKNFKITKEEISQKREEIMMMVRSSMIFDLKRIDHIEGAVFIYSLWEGYLKEDSMKHLMDFTKDKNMDFHSIHTSGHAYIETLKKVVDHLKPERIFPIHTFYPDEYKIFGDRVYRISDGEIVEV